MDRAYHSHTFTIPNTGTAPTTDLDGSASDGAMFVGDRAFGSVLFPAAMTGTKLLVQHKYAADGTWVAATNPVDGVQYEVLKQLSKSCRIPDAAFGAPYMRLVSDAAEGADRSFTVHLQA